MNQSSRIAGGHYFWHERAKGLILALIVVLIAAFLPSCAKKQNLVDKAFEGKRFEMSESDQDDLIKEVPDKEDEKKEHGEQMLSDQRTQLPEGPSTTFPEGTLERSHEIPIKVNPPSPILNFEEAKLYDVIHKLCELMEVNYIIDPSVQDQTITIGMVEGDQQLSTAELFDLILKLHNLTMLVQDSFIRIVPLDSPDVIPGLELLYGSMPNENLMREELAIQIVPLRYTRPSDISPLISEFLSPVARVLEEPKQNLLIIIDKYNFITRVMDLLPIFDISALKNKKIVLYQLEHVDAVDTASEVQDILAAYGFPIGGESEAIRFFPIETLNAILVISNTDEVHHELSYWLDKLDQEAKLEENQVFVYQVQNTTADALASTLSAVYGGGGGMGMGLRSPGASQRRTTSPNRDPNDQTNRTDQPDTTRTDRQFISGAQQQRGDMPVTEESLAIQSMVLDIDNNALIFNTTARQYYKVLKTLKKLDILPRQVFLEVTVLTVDLNDTFNVGFNWSASSGIGNDSQATTRSFAFAEDSTAFVYSYAGLTKSIEAQITAAKTKGYANVLQQPHIMAIDNRPASISIGTDVPILTSNINVPGANTNTGSIITTSNVQYRQTGVNLSFTPHINANGVIRMELSLSISSLGASTATANDQPAISQNSLDSEMIVRDNQTIVMGGMISDSEDWSRSHVPGLGKIPLIKHLFSNRKNSIKKSELIVMITPRLIDTEQKSVDISKEFKDKILKEFEGFKASQD